MNDFLNKVITIAEVTAKEFGDNTKFTVKDTNGDKYNFRIKKADGTNTKAFLNYSQLGVKQGGTYEITYAENDKEYMGRHYKDRMILGFKSTSGSPTTIPPKSAVSEANKVQSGLSGRNWDREAYEKCCSIWAAALLQRLDKPNPEVIIKAYLEEGDFYQLFQAIKKDGEQRFSGDDAGLAVFEF